MAEALYCHRFVQFLEKYLRKLRPDEILKDDGGIAEFVKTGGGTARARMYSILVNAILTRD